MMPSRPCFSASAKNFVPNSVRCWLKESSWLARQNAAQPLLALKKRKAPQIFAVAEHHVEDAVEELRLMAQRILQQLEARDAVPIQRDEFAVENSVDFEALESTRDLDVTVADDLAVAAVEGNASVFDDGHHPETVVLVFKDPVTDRRTARR